MTHKFQKIAEEVTKSYINTPNLIGIIWIGSSSYNILDKETNIDIRLIFSRDEQKFTMKQFVEKGVKVEVSKIKSSWLFKKVQPDREQFWIRKKGIILYDPEKVLANKFRILNKVKTETYTKLLCKLYKDIFHSYDFEKTVKRNDMLAGLMYFFKTLDAFSRFCFIYHNRVVPTFKWRWYFIDKDKLLDLKIIKRLKSFNAKDSSNIYSVLRTIEKEARSMMLKKGYSKEFVNEPWLF